MSDHTVVVLQPSYIPWRGTFDLIDRADTFVFYDDVQYDKHGWRNRNRIKTKDGGTWLTIPVHSRKNVVDGTPIDRITIDWTRDWTKTHIATIRHAYARAPFLEDALEPMIARFAQRPERLVDVTIDLTIAYAKLLGCNPTRFVRSSELAVGGTKNGRLLATLAAVGATHYISGPSAKAYIDEAAFDAAGIALEYIAYDYPEYEQLHAPYDGAVSIVDTIAMSGPSAIDHVRAARCGLR